MTSPLIINPDLTIFVMRDSERYAEARDLMLLCAELEKSPGHVQVYSLTPISLWNAAALGLQAEHLISQLSALSHYPLPESVRAFITDMIGRYGALVLRRDGGCYVLDVVSDAIRPSLVASPELARFFSTPVGSHSFVIDEVDRGALKLALIERGLPVVDRAGYCNGDPLFQSEWDREVNRTFTLRGYQGEAVASFLGNDAGSGGSGVIVLPCGAGKTLVGGEIITAIQMKTLILTANIVAAKQWRAELTSKFNLPDDLIGEYHGQSKVVRPITIATYQIFSKRDATTRQFEHLAIANEHNWGLVIYDEVHMLPAELFRMTSQLQARRRLGLTATLVREDNKEPQVFSLIGPKRYEVPWRILEQQGWIAKARCFEIRVPFSRSDQALHDGAEKRHRFRLAAENVAKVDVIKHLLGMYCDEKVLIIGTFVEHIRSIAREVGWPVLDGGSSQRERDEVFRRFRSGEIRGVVVSKIANTSIDLPDASMIIQVSGQFGSRQEEAQRLGRALRPKLGANQALFFTVVTENSAEEPFADNRQKFLLEQGYDYERLSWEVIRSREGVGASLQREAQTGLAAAVSNSDGAILDALTSEVSH